MSTEITTGFSKQFASNVELLLQQKQSRLRSAVRVESYTGEGAQVVQQVGAAAAVKRTTRHADTPILNTPHAVRWVFPEDYEWGDLIDNPDKLKTLANFESPYVQTAAAALNRGIDDEIIGSMFSDTTKTGVAGTTSTTWTAFIAANATHRVAASAAGLTVAKLRSAVKVLRAAEVDLDNEQIFCAVTAKQIDDLFDETQIISLDYNTSAVLVDGKLKPFMGINFIHTERLTTTSGTDHNVPVWAKSGVALGIWQDVKGRVAERADKSFATQVYASLSCGATRVEEKKLVEIRCVF